MKQTTVYEYWEQRAKEVNDGTWRTTSNDPILAELEIKELLKELKDGSTVLEMGCGNGRIAKEICSKIKIDYTGVDIAQNMVELAQKQGIPRAKFMQGDLLKFHEGQYDIIFTVRTLTNLLDFDSQVQAFKNISSLLKDNGKFVLLEPTMQGLNNINVLRKAVGLDLIDPHQFNCYLDLDRFEQTFKNQFNISLEYFAGSYYLTSRLFYAYQCKITGQEMKYDSEMNLMSKSLPSVGHFAPHVKIVCTKKK